MGGMNRREFVALPLVAASANAAPAPKPNILYFLADDFGFGDAGFQNPKSRIPTPNLDRLARQGIHFTDAHDPTAVCSPTRYGILTGGLLVPCMRVSVLVLAIGFPCYKVVHCLIGAHTLGAKRWLRMLLVTSATKAAQK